MAVPATCHVHLRFRTLRQHSAMHHTLPITGMILTGLCVATSVCRGQEVDGFLEPYRSVDVPSLEMGAIEHMHVREGDRVEKGKPLAALDHAIHRQQLLIAKQSMDAIGRIESAKAELALSDARLKKLLQLRNKGFARQEEVERTRADVAVARGDLLTAEEDAAIKRLEYEKARIQLQRRTITAPIAGVISIVHKEVGEFVSQNDPYILQIVQLDKLRINFSVPSEATTNLHHGQRVVVHVGQTHHRASGIVEFVSPITDAESGTVRVKVQIDNSQRDLRSGDRGTLLLPEAKIAATPSRSQAHSP